MVKTVAQFRQTFLERSGAFDATAGKSAPHIVDVLIGERGHAVMSAPWWPVVRPFIFKMLRYRQAVEMADTIAPMSALDVFDHVSDLLQLNVAVQGLNNVPARGPVVLVSNHPTGIADGIALYDAIRDRRRDLAIFANRDAIRVNPRLAEMIVPVEWRPEFKNRDKARETLKLAARAFEQARAVVLFPSGRLAHWHDGRLTERPWMTSAIALARRHRVPIIPIHMSGRNSRLFYALARISTELRDMTVFNELLNKKDFRFKVTFGEPIAPGALQGNLDELTSQLRLHCTETLRTMPSARFLSAGASSPCAAQ